MSEHNHDNDPIEEFFRNKSGEFDIPYREEDWQKLEQKLDLRAAQRSYRRKITLVAAAAVLIISMLGYFTLDNYNRLNELAEQVQQQEEEVIELPGNVEAPESEDDTFASDDIRSEPPAPPDPGVELTPVTPEEATAVADPDGEIHSTETPSAELFAENIGFDRQRISGYAVTTPPSMDSAPVRDAIAARAEAPRQASALSTLSQGTERETPRFERDPASRFSVGLAFSPDISTVNSISNFHNPGYKLGLNLEYKVGDNITISTGVVRSFVRYTARPNEYQAPVYWESGSEPREMVAKCLVLDIPLTIKYNVMNFENSRLFATAGVSSYIMLNEEYRFDYADDTENGIDGWSGRTGTTHWFSNAGISVGYELDVHPNWSVRAEPFMKIPMGEIGWGNVRLFSFGTFISLNYNL